MKKSVSSLHWFLRFLLFVLIGSLAMYLLEVPSSETFLQSFRHVAGYGVMMYLGANIKTYL